MVIMSFIFISLEVSCGLPSAVSNIVWLSLLVLLDCDDVGLVVECVKLFEFVPVITIMHKSN